MENQVNGVVETPTQTQPSFDADSFFESLNKRADDFFNNTAKKQLEKKFGMSEDEIMNLIAIQKNKQQEDVTTLKSENENLRNEIKNIKKNNSIDNVLKTLDVKPEKRDYLLKLTDLEDIFDEQGEVDTKKVTKAFEEVLKNVPEFKNSKEQDFGSYQNQQKPNTKAEEVSIFGFDFKPVR